MADIMLHTSSSNQVTCVSNYFIDDFMKDANGEYVKIYLYLLRCLGRDDYDFSIQTVADRLEHTEKDVMRALTYWEKVGLLRLEYTSENELSGICLVDVQGHDQVISPVVTTTFTPVTITAPASTASAVGAPITTTFPVPMKPSYSADDLLEFSAKDGVSDLIFASEFYLGRPLSTSETTSLLYWNDELKLPTDLIEYLIEYCISGGHRSFHYMDAVARNWANDGILTLDAAKAETRSHSNMVYSIMKAMGISGRDLIKTELDCIDKWTMKYGFSEDIICDACTRTIAACNKPSFKYCDSILTKWYESNVKTMDDIAVLDKAFTSAASKKAEAKTKSTTSTQRAASTGSSKTAWGNFPGRDEIDWDKLAKSLQ